MIYLSTLWLYMMLLVVLAGDTFAGLANQQLSQKSSDQQPKSELGSYFVEVFDLSTAGGDPRSYAIISDERGRIYVANQNGIFMFDGSRWWLLKGLGELDVRSLAIQNHKLYIGAHGDFGYIALNAISGNTTHKFNSLIGQFSLNKRDIGVIKDTVVRPEGVYFRANNGIYFYANDGRTSVIAAQNTTFHRMYVVHDKLIMQKRRVGLFEVKNGRVSDFVQGDFFADKTIYGLLELNQSFLIFSADKGIYHYDGSKIRPFVLDTDLQQLLKYNQIYLARRLRNGLLGLAVTGPQQGVILLNDQGHLIKLIDSKDGLSDTLISDMLEDEQGGLWLASMKGIDRIEVSSPLTFFDQRHGLDGYLFDMLRYQSQLYVATSEGVYLLKSADFYRAHFEKLVEIDEACLSLVKTQYGVLVACDANLYQIRGDQVQHVWQFIHNTYRLLDVSTDLSQPQLLVGHSERLGLLSLQDQQWQYQALLEVSGVDMAQDQQGVLWLRNQQQGVIRVAFLHGFDEPPQVNFFNQSDGLPDGRIYPTTMNGEVLFNSRYGLFTFQSGLSLEDGYFVPNMNFGDFTGKDVYLSTAKTGVQYIVERIPVNGLYNRSKVRLAILSQANGQYQFNYDDYIRLSRYPLLNIYPEYNDVIWVMSDDRLLRRQSLVTVNDTQSPYISEIASLQHNRQHEFSLNTPLVLNFADNSIRFNFAFTSFNDYRYNQFQYKLVGYDQHWSDWKTLKYKEYTQIIEGEYRFELRAKDAYERVSSAQSLDVVILPPWFRTWWAYSVYVLCFFYMIFLGIKYRTRALIERASHLEKIIEQRTRVVREGSVMIQKQKESIERLFAEKNDLFANISHEFRTPLTLILGPIQSLLKQPLSVVQHQSLSLIQVNTYRLLRMVEQIMTLSQLNAMPHQERVLLSVKEHVNLVVDSFMPSIVEKQITLHVSGLCDVKVCMVHDALEKIFINIISNAVKYTPEGGEIDVSVKKITADKIRIKVTDTGYGIPAEQISQIFERYQRINRPQHIKVQGTGLGLSIVKELVESHDGQIEVSSQVSVGSTFIIELPIVDDHRSQQVVDRLEQTQHSVELELRSLELPQLHEQRNNQATNKYKVESQLTLLVIEDNHQMLSFIISLFDEQYQVIGAIDGEQGIALAKQQLPDIILSDVMMPDKTGLQVCSQLKNDTQTSHIPIILLTAKADLESRLQGWREQADEYLIKPFDEDELKLRVTNLLAIRKTLKQRFARMVHSAPEQLKGSSKELTEKDQKFLQRFIKVIEDNYTNTEFSLPLAASDMYVSERLLQKKLKALIDHTFTEYLRTYRLNQACEILKAGNRISDVAAQCGFSSQAYFSRCFKAEFGQTASQFQQSQ